MTRLKFLPIILALVPNLVFAAIVEAFPSAGPSAACEFYLGGLPDSASAQKWLWNRISSLRQGAEVTVSSELRGAEAFTVLGLPKNLPRGLNMQLIPPEAGQNTYRLVVKGESGTIAEFPFELPPVYVWKDIDDLESPLFLRADVNGENMRKIAIGTVIREFEHGRIFVSVRVERSVDRVIVSLGLDVDPDDRLLYTRNSTPNMILREHREGFQRIEVLNARFPIREAPVKPLVKPLTYFSR